ncbi:MAG: hypothetical protein LAO09_03105 [Acidobacteriia bacterium]|nr:hypothetical protein [Terriglobia bacterium]
MTGQIATLPVTLTNNGRNTVTVSTLLVNAPAFSTDDLNLPLTLTPWQRVTISVTFTPQSPGYVYGFGVASSVYGTSQPDGQEHVRQRYIADGTVRAQRAVVHSLDGEFGAPGLYPIRTRWPPHRTVHIRRPSFLSCAVKS